MHKLTRALLLAGLIAPPVTSQAETVSSGAEKPGAPATGLPFDHSGHIDIGYTALSGWGKFINGVNDRVFDFDRDSLSLQAIDLTLSKLPESGFGALVNFTIGKDADTIAAYGTIDKSRGPANGVHKKFDVTQAYAQYASGPVTVILGKFVTLAGAEVIKSPSDVNYSRSILFGYAIPFTHTGVRATYKASDTLSLTAGVNNGWDDFQDTNGAKTLELGVAYAPIKAFSLAAQAYSGKEQIFNYPTVSPVGGTRNLIDVVATYNATDKLSFVFNYDYGSQANATLINGTTGTAKWDGVAGYVNYQFNEKWRLSLRGEYFNDRDGYRTAVEPGKTSGQKWKEVTATLAYLPTKDTEVRVEVRGDRSDQKVFLDSDGITPVSSQRSFGLEFLYKF